MSNPMNILVLMCDHHRFDALSCLANPLARTPNLDALASQSVRFSSCYTQSPVCSPARHSLATGQYVLLTLAHVVAMALGLVIPAALVASVVLALGLLGAAPGPWHVPILALLAAVPLAAEAAALVWLAGRRWDRLDPPREILEGIELR